MTRTTPRPHGRVHTKCVFNPRQNTPKLVFQNRSSSVRLSPNRKVQEKDTSSGYEMMSESRKFVAGLDAGFIFDGDKRARE